MIYIFRMNEEDRHSAIIALYAALVAVAAIAGSAIPQELGEVWNSQNANGLLP